MKLRAPVRVASLAFQNEEETEPALRNERLPSSCVGVSHQHNNPNAATIGYKKGTWFQSTDAGRLGRRHLYEYISMNYLLGAATGTCIFYRFVG
jgi:hypothetical protein